MAEQEHYEVERNVIGQEFYGSDGRVLQEDDTPPEKPPHVLRAEQIAREDPAGFAGDKEEEEDGAEAAEEDGEEQEDDSSESEADEDEEEVSYE